MAYQDMALPVDIPWKRLAASSDMMDLKYGDRRFPPKWRSSVSVFYHEPTEFPETYCDRKITYLKIVCSITGYQQGAEVGATDPVSDDTWHAEPTKLGDEYHPCYGALLHVAVFPNTQDDKQVLLSDFPYIVDFEPKRRELYEAVSKSGEVLGRSLSELNIRKGTTNAATTEISSKVGAQVGVSYGVVSGSVSASHEWGGGTHEQEENVRTTDESREQRETYSATTNLTQMYELFTGYHLGSNRALFYILSRPHTTEEKDQYTFVNGPRRLEGIQEVFLVVNRPKNQPGLCVETFLETAHLFAATAESGESPTGAPQVTEWEEKEYSTGFSGAWESPYGEPGQSKEFTKTLMPLPAGCEIDTSRGGGSWWTETWENQPSLLITVPPGYKFDFLSEGTFWRSLKEISAGVSGGQVTVTVTLRGMARGWQEQFNAVVTVYYRCPKPQGAPDPPPGEDEGAGEQKTLFLTSRGLGACVRLQETEKSHPNNVDGRVQWDRVFASENEDELLRLLERHRIFEPRDAEPEEYRRKLRQRMKRNRSRFENRVKEAFDEGSIDPVSEWLLPSEWISFETKIPVSALMSDPQVPASERIRSANGLTNRIGDAMMQSVRSSSRYEDRAVDLWHTNMALDRLSRAISILPDDNAQNVRVADLEISHRDALLSRFGRNVRRKEIVELDLPALQRELGIDAMEARRLKLELIRIRVPPPEPSASQEKKGKKRKTSEKKGRQGS